MAEEPAGSSTARGADAAIIASAVVIAGTLGTFLATGALAPVSQGWFAVAPLSGEVFVPASAALRVLAWRGPALLLGAALAVVVLVIGVRARRRRGTLPRGAFGVLALAAVPAVVTVAITVSVGDAIQFG